MKPILKTLPIAAFLVLSFSAGAETTEKPLDPNLRNLRWSGILRTRAWHYEANSRIAPATATNSTGNVKQSASFQDLFFRNRFSLNIMPILEVRTLFDIGTLKFGAPDSTRENGSALGDPQAKIKAKEIYFRFRPTDQNELLVGLQPFSFPGGHILAKDGAGFRYQHRLFHGKWQPYIQWVKAYDNSTTDVDGNALDDTDFNDHDIYSIGSNLALGNSFKSDYYYVYSENLSSFNQTVKTFNAPFFLNWAGVHNRFFRGRWSFELSGIYNWGFLHIPDRSNPAISSRSYVSAGLWSFLASLSIGDFQLGFITEGATGDPGNEQARYSFQSLSPSHGLSDILIDNNGGIGVRSSGKLYGLEGYGIRAEYLLLSALSLEFKYLRFHRTGDITESFASSFAGDEVNLKASYLLYEKISFYSTMAGFFPGEGFTSLNSHHEMRPVYEIMIGAEVNY